MAVRAPLWTMASNRSSFAAARISALAMVRAAFELSPYRVPAARSAISFAESTFTAYCVLCLILSHSDLNSGLSR